MKTKLLAAAAVMMIPLAGLAAEPETMPPSETTGPGATFDALDTNKDGALSKDELVAGRPVRK